MNEPEVVTESVMGPPVEANANGSSGPVESAPAVDAVSTTPPLPEMAPPAPAMAAIVPAAPIGAKGSSGPVGPAAAVDAVSTTPPLPEMAPPAPPMAVIVPAGDPLEERLRRLEATLTALAEAKQAAPVAKLAPETPTRNTAGAIRESAGRVVDAGRWLLPLALGGMKPTPEETTPADGKSPWFLLDALNELITYKYMYGDPRYRLTWTGRVLPLVFLVFVLVVPWDKLPFINLLPGILATGLARLLDLLFAFLLFKVLNREGRRYRAIIPQYPPVSPS